MTFDDILSADAAGAYGVVVQENGVLLVSGKLRFGDSSGSSSTYFRDSNRVIVFKNWIVGDSFYELRVQGNSSGTTYFFLGSKVGTGDSAVGSGGCFVKTNGQKYALEMDQPNVSGIGLYGCTFVGAGIVNCDRSSTEAVSSSFLSCGQVKAGTGTFLACTFATSSATASGAMLLPAGNTHNVRYSQFSDNARGVEIPNAGTYTFTGLKFYGNTYDVRNSSGGAVTINASSGSNVSTYENTSGSTTTINNTVNLTLTGLVPGSEVRIYDQSMNELDGTESSGSTFVFTYNYTPDTAVDIVIHSLGYQYYRIEDYILPATDSALPVKQLLDRQYENP